MGGGVVCFLVLIQFWAQQVLGVVTMTFVVMASASFLVPDCVASLEVVLLLLLLLSVSRPISGDTPPPHAPFALKGAGLGGTYSINVVYVNVFLFGPETAADSWRWLEVYQKAGRGRRRRMRKQVM